MSLLKDNNGDVFNQTNYPYAEITTFPGISHDYGISAIFKMQMTGDVTNEDGTYNIDVKMDEIDIHVEYDSFGSNEEYVKY